MTSHPIAPRLLLVVVVVVLAAAAQLAGGAQRAHATYPGTNDGRLAFAMNVGGNVDIYSVLPNGNDLQRLTDDSSFDAAAFFFQAEDGIRVGRVTGVQTCALPI